MKKAVLGILAHVDAGKTTLSESMLYLAGQIRKLGRVDHGTSVLDYNELEKQRGITIFSKQAIFNYEDWEITLIDTPGHIDFSAEMERTLQILDYAIIVISGIDGIQNHTKTIWKLLEMYQIPTFLFINKMDMPITNEEKLLKQLKEELSEYCLPFSSLDEKDYESIALLDDKLLETYLTKHQIPTSTLQTLIQERKIFPCFFGSALKIQGVEDFMKIMTTYMKEKQYPNEFGAKIYKITREEGQRLVHMKITGGTLQTKQIIQDEKVDRIMQYQGSKYQVVQKVEAGSLCSVKGLKSFQAGDGLGIEKRTFEPTLTPYMNYQLLLPSSCDYIKTFTLLKQLEEEDPLLHMTFDQNKKEIDVQLMGEIQIDVLKKMIKDRFDIDVELSKGKIIYKETIKNTVEGVGHFEPLRHYAEVHLLMEPLPLGSGLIFDSQCLEDELAGHYQRLILSHLKEKEHVGVLTGSSITDIKITLVRGKAHLKHTEGGDFRQATYRALRQGLKMAECVLLEPYYQFQLEIPNDYLSKAIYDLEKMNSTFQIETNEQMSYLYGEAAISKMQNYQEEVFHYTKGQGKLYCTLSSYKECDEQEERIKEIGYNSETDIENPTSSVFCQHGAGFNVLYNEVYQYMHLPLYLKKESQKEKREKYISNDEDDLKKIFERTYGPIQTKTKQYQNIPKKEVIAYQPTKPKCLLIDGYNVLFSWDQLKDIAKENLDVARERLIDIISNYQGYIHHMVILVFDAYKVKGNRGSKEKYHNIYVVYTKEAQTADMYIERTTHLLAKDFDITVATSDALEQLIVIGQGANRISSRQLILEIESITNGKYQEFLQKQKKSRNFLLEEIKEYEKKG